MPREVGNPVAAAAAADRNFMSFVLGIVISCIVLVSITLQNGNPAMLIDPSAIVLVTGCTAASFLIICPFSALGETVSAMFRTLLPTKNIRGLFDQVVKLAAVARKNGILGLEGCELRTKDRILKKGIILLLESVDPETLRQILENDSARFSEKERTAQEVLERLAVFSPGIGMVGTLIQIVQVLNHFKNLSAIAPQIAHALLPMVYGAVISYLLLFPLAARIKCNAARRKTARDFLIEGVLAIQAGEPPQLIEQRFDSILK